MSYRVIPFDFGLSNMQYQKALSVPVYNISYMRRGLIQYSKKNIIATQFENKIKKNTPVLTLTNNIFHDKYGR